VSTINASFKRHFKAALYMLAYYLAPRIISFKAYDTSEVTYDSHFGFHKCHMTDLQVEARKLQVKRGVASWVLLCCELKFNLTTAIMLVMIFKLKSHFQ